MPVTLLRGENLRLYRRFEIQPHPALNLVVGTNAAGKTSLLEALFMAARGRSFRAQNLAEVCGTYLPQWHVFMEVENKLKRHRIGLGWSRDRTEVRLDEDRNTRLADVVRAVPMQLIDPLAHRLLDEGPAYRRSFVDWGVFHVEHRFLETWRRYQRALRQRNRALREQMPVKAIQAWDEELAESGENLSLMRTAHVQAAAPGLQTWGCRLLGTEGVRCEWQRGWSQDETLRESLKRNLDQHQRQGTTVQGPHRAELRISLAETRAKGRVSRGQQKMLITAMVLAQAELLTQSGSEPPVLLLDDFAAELAPEFQARLADGLRAYAGQKFVTAFAVPEGFSDPSERLAMFHVEHGSILTPDRLH